jgi:hypothetical protein
MALSTLIALLQDAPQPDLSGTQHVVQAVCLVLALALVAIIIMRRRKGKKKDEEEEF